MIDNSCLKSTFCYKFFIWLICSKAFWSLKASNCYSVNTLNSCLHIFNHSAHCARGGAVGDDFLGIGGSVTIFLTRSQMACRRFFCLDIVDDSDFYRGTITKYWRHSAAPLAGLIGIKIHELLSTGGTLVTSSWQSSVPRHPDWEQLR